MTCFLSLMLHCNYHCSGSIQVGNTLFALIVMVFIEIFTGMCREQTSDEVKEVYHMLFNDFVIT